MFWYIFIFSRCLIIRDIQVDWRSTRPTAHGTDCPRDRQYGSDEPSEKLSEGLRDQRVGLRGCRTHGLSVSCILSESFQKANETDMLALRAVDLLYLLITLRRQARPAISTSSVLWAVANNNIMMQHNIVFVWAFCFWCSLSKIFQSIATLNFHWVNLNCYLLLVTS